MSINTPENAASEARYVAKALGSSLLGFEIGNECDVYSKNGIRPPTYKYPQYLAEWRTLAAAIRAVLVKAGGN